jgi:hypothetical protein
LLLFPVRVVRFDPGGREMSATAVQVLKTYYVVPGQYTVDFENKEDETFGAALNRALGTIKPFDFGGYSRAFVDERVVEARDGGGSYDDVRRRWEVFADGSVKVVR